MGLPSRVSYCTITGRFLQAVAVGAAGGAQAAEALPVDGLTITLTADLSPAIVKSVAEVPVTFAIEPIQCATDSEGFLLDASGARGVVVVASDDPDLEPHGWSWRATLTAPGWRSPYAFSFEAPSDGAVNLASVTPVPSEPAEELQAWKVAVAEANAARDEAVTAKLAAVTAATESSEARTAASTARTGAEAAREGAETARTGAEAARSGAETARSGAEAARDLALAGQFAGATLGTADLNAITSPGIYFQNDSAAATAVRNYPTAAPCSLEVLPWNRSANSNAVVQRLTVLGGPNAARVVYLRRWNGGWNEWGALTIQRVDQAAGRAVYTWDPLNGREQLTFGDTGQRDISALVAADDWNLSSAGHAILQRYGALCSLAFRARAARDLAPGTNLLVIPTGFRVSGRAPGTVPVSLGSVANPSGVAHVRAMPVTNLSGAIDLRTSVTAGTEIALLLTWLSTEAWPTALPGSAVGSIPNL